MKNIKKIIAVLMSLTAIASTTAMAATEATYEDGTASLVLAENDITAAANDQLTVVIVPKDAESITSGNIYYINQGAFEEEFTNILAEMKVKDGFGTATDYEVRIGGVKKDGEYAVAKFNFKAEAPVVIDYGNVDGLGVVDSTDVTMAARAVVKQITLTADELLRANVDNTNDVVDSTDVTKIARYVVKQITDWGIN